MKKILVLMLVLGITSMASAGLTYNVSSVSIGIGESTTVQLVSSDGAMGQVWLKDLTNAIYEVTAITPLANAGDDATSSLYTSGSWAKATILDSGEPFNNAAGNVFDVVILGIGAGTGYLDSDYYATLGANAPLTVIVPEPLTVGLLGLGGLFLRRRK